jgi:predicted CoA-substrate-specific enzyme activase
MNLFQEESKAPFSNKSQPVGRKRLRNGCKAGSGKITAGIDVGSRTIKVVILGDSGILSSTVLYSGIHPNKKAQNALKTTCGQLGLRKHHIQAMVGTGYGRVSLSFTDATATELSCHAKGVHFCNPEIRTVIDIGGQDSKVIHLDGQGNMTDFAMNDRCAAGTGKFLEMVARTLEIDLTVLANMRPTARPATINSMCVVFVETEIVSLLANEVSPARIVTGVNRAFSQRIGNMVKRLGIRSKVAFTGGVAKNRGLAQALSTFLDQPFESLDIDPQLTGALGAAVLARELPKKSGE